MVEEQYENMNHLSLHVATTGDPVSRLSCQPLLDTGVGADMRIMNYIKIATIDII